MSTPTCEKGGNRIPALTHILGASKEEASKGSVEGIDAMIEELAERSALVRASSVRDIYGLDN